MQYRDEKFGKNNRILDIMLRLTAGEVINKQLATDVYQVNERTIRRDIETIRSYYSEKMAVTGEYKDVIYSPEKKGYVLTEESKKTLSNGEALAVSKILLESRAFSKEEMFTILNKIVSGCVPSDRKEQVRALLRNEEFYFLPLQHNKPLIDNIWELGQAISEQCKVRMRYSKMDGSLVERLVKPVGILFSEFYFYLIAFLNEDSEVSLENVELIKLSPAIYRIDRIKEYQVLSEHFEVPYKDRFQEGEFRKRVQFMYGGPLRKVRFEYHGSSIEAVLDRLPTAVIEKEEKGVYTVTAEVFGKGIDMWLGSQGDVVKVLET